MPETQHGRDLHRAIELYERMALAASARGLDSHDPRVVRLISACVVEDAARRWFERRGYTMPPRDVR